MSKARPTGPIFALSPLQPVVDRLALAWGVQSFRIPVAQSMEDLIDGGERVLLQQGLIRPGQTLVILGGNAPEHGATSFVKFHVVRAPGA